MSRKRLTVRKVRLAYKKIDKKPTRGQSWTGDGGCCPAVAVGLAEGLLEGGVMLSGMDSEYGESYMNGFILGVDHPESAVPAETERNCGFADGVKVYRALKKEFARCQKRK